MINIFTKIESNVRSYCRSFPVVFTKSVEHEVFDSNGNVYIDFLSGAGSLNYGHNNPCLKQELIDYIQQDGISHSLDLHTEAKRKFLECFNEIILKPRNLDYKVMFPGPTGTNAVEAAMKLARKATGRKTIVHCKKSFHGVTLGSLAVTDNPKFRNVSGVPLTNTYSIPFVCKFDETAKELDSFVPILNSLDAEGKKPAAIILETVQGEGGINVANSSWLKKLFEYAKEHKILVIVDDIQAGCGRTGTFFSFERAGLKPDLVCLSKSISGYGTPMSLVLISPDNDLWEAGEHNGTFRGNNLAFVTAAAALSKYWKTDEFENLIKAKGEFITQRLEEIVARYPKLNGKHRGLGFMQGIACASTEIPGKVSLAAFERGLIVETAGHKGEVIKLLPPLTIDSEALAKGIDILEDAIYSVLLEEEQSQSFYEVANYTNCTNQEATKIKSPQVDVYKAKF
ncbi:MAG: diaminobutyrate--2-oxoglutarate transaminase [Cyanobacteria bacterium J06633_8]